MPLFIVWKRENQYSAVVLLSKCKHILSWYDLAPLLVYFIEGKCRLPPNFHPISVGRIGDRDIVSRQFFIFCLMDNQFFARGRISRQVDNFQ